MDRIDFRKESGVIDRSYSSNSKSNNKLDINANVPAFINKAIKHNFKGMEELCKACIESKYMRIVRSKRIIPIM